MWACCWHWVSLFPPIVLYITHKVLCTHRYIIEKKTEINLLAVASLELLFIYFGMSILWSKDQVLGFIEVNRANWYFESLYFFSLRFFNISFLKIVAIIIQLNTFFLRESMMQNMFIKN